MTWMLFAGFEGREAAERALGELLELGVPMTELSLVAAAPGNPSSERSRSLEMVKAGQTHAEARVGVTPATHALIGAQTDVGDMAKVSGKVASNVPIAVRSVDAKEPPYAATMLLTRLFGTTQKGIPGSADWAGDGGGLSAQVVNGTLILGSGALATEVLAGKLRSPSRSTASCVQAGLYTLGVAPTPVKRLFECLCQDGAVIAAAESTGSVRLEAMEFSALHSGAFCMKMLV